MLFEKIAKAKNVPTNKSLWGRAKAEAKKKFDVYPSVYANAWAAKWYKNKGGKWRKGNATDDESYADDQLFSWYGDDNSVFDGKHGLESHGGGLGGKVYENSGLGKWEKENWVRVSDPSKPCGRRDADKGKYPKCLPKNKVKNLSKEKRKKEVTEKRRAESKSKGGNNDGRARRPNRTYIKDKRKV